MIFEDCWNEISAASCVYSGYSFEGDEFRVFVECGLDTWSTRLQTHIKPNGVAGIGKCTLIFNGVYKYQWRETPFTKSATGQVIWGKAAIKQYSANDTNNNEPYFMDGISVDGSKAIWVEVNARSFALDAQ